MPFTQPDQIMEEKLISAPQQLRELIQELSMLLDPILSPFRLHITPHKMGFRLVGDHVALVIAEHVFERINANPGDFIYAQEPARLKWVEDGVKKALRYNLSMRLEGVVSPLKPASIAQLSFMDVLLGGNFPYVFGVGPPGSGKTHLALAAAVNLLASGQMKHIVVTRPHFLYNGETMTPEIRWETAMDEQFTSILDILIDLTSMTRVKEWRETRKLELIPTGLMQGRTFNDSILLIDEAQNIDIPTMRMAVTRIGKNARAIITGDPNQNILRTHEPSGLPHLMNLLNDSELAHIHRFKAVDIVRNPAVAELEKLYDSETAAA